MKRGAVAAMLCAAAIADAAPDRTTRLEVLGNCELSNVVTRASELLGRAAIELDAASVVRVVIARDGDALDATLTFVDENGLVQPPRPIQAASCEELAESVAIVISLVLRSEAAEPAAPPPQPPPPAPVEAQEETKFTPTRPAPTRALELAAQTSSARQSALVLGARVERRRMALGLDLELVLPSTVEVTHGSVHVAGARADVAGCLRAGRFAGCGLVGAGVVHGRGEDLMDARAALRPVAGVGLRAEWRQPVSRWLGVRVFASLDQALVRPRFLVEDTPVWTSPLLQAWLGTGVFLRIP